MTFLAGPPPIGISTEIPIVEKLFGFYKLFHLLLGKFSKGDKHTLGMVIQRTVLELLEISLSAGNNKGVETKRQVLSEASAKLDLLKLLIRLAYEIRAIDQKAYLQLQGYLQEIGRMIGGWLRSLR